MKDARGHGSNTKGGSLANTLKAISDRRKSEFGASAGFRAPINTGAPEKRGSEFGQYGGHRLQTDPVHRNHPKTKPVPAHSAMGGGRY